MLNEKMDEQDHELQETVTNDAAKGWVGLTEDARQATANEHKLGIFQALKIYRKAVGWSCAVSRAIVMDGYDTALISSLFGLPAFQQRFGIPYKNGYQVSAHWQLGLGLAATLGNIIGIFVNSAVTERFGHKKVLLFFYGWITAAIFCSFFAPTVAVLFVGQILCGISWGVFSTMGKPLIKQY